MTQWYLAGELSLLLEHLESAGLERRAVRDLRAEAERRGPVGLVVVLVRTLELTDSRCWESLTRGDARAFDRQAATAARLREFGVCARLFDEIG